MQKAISKRQKELLNVIYKYIKETGYPPTFEDMKKDLDLSSNQSILDLLKHLETKKAIKRDEGEARGIVITSEGYNIINQPPLIINTGTSYAGSFTATYQNNLWTQLSDEVKINQDMFLVEISGDSMIEAGINNGDILLAKRSTEFTNRDIVVVQLFEGTTVKRFMTQNHAPHKFLKPENKKYDIILFKPETKMQAKIIGKMVNGKIIPINSKTKSFL